MVAAALVLAPAAHAASLQEQIDALNQAAAQQQSQAQNLRSQGDTLAGRLAQINAQIASIRNQLANSRAKQVKLTAQIAEAKAQLVIKKQILDESVRTIYQQSQVSALEMLASSKNFSEYVDKQMYQDRIKDHVQQSAEAVSKLKADLEKQQADLEIAIKQQSDLSQAVALQQAEAANLLAQTRGEEARYQQMAAANSAKSAELQRQQAAILAQQFKGGNISGGSPCGGGYPYRWCSAPRDTLVDSWGMYNRECVSYTAFKVASSGRYMPYWGGRGNAKQWPDSARADGIPVDDKPRVGDVAISLAGPYGHAMYVEAVNGGNITVSQYNFGFKGEYSTMTVSAGGLQFIHF